VSNKLTSEDTDLNINFFFFIRENFTLRKAHFVGPGEGVKPRLFQALTRGARPDSNSKPAVQISNPLPLRYTPRKRPKHKPIHVNGFYRKAKFKTSWSLPCLRINVKSTFYSHYSTFMVHLLRDQSNLFILITNYQERYTVNH